MAVTVGMVTSDSFELRAISHCQHCGHEWQDTFQQRITASTESSNLGHTVENAQYLLQMSAREFSATLTELHGLVCPRCYRPSELAERLYFSKGLAHAYRQSVIKSIVAVFPLPLGILAIAGFFLAAWSSGAISNDISPLTALLIFGGLCVLLLGLIARFVMRQVGQCSAAASYMRASSPDIIGRLLARIGWFMTIKYASVDPVAMALGKMLPRHPLGMNMAIFLDQPFGVCDYDLTACTEKAILFFKKSEVELADIMRENIKSLPYITMDMALSFAVAIDKDIRLPSDIMNALSELIGKDRDKPNEKMDRNLMAAIKKLYDIYGNTAGNKNPSQQGENIFSYTARTRKGEKVCGQIIEKDRKSALVSLEQKGIVPISLQVQPKGAGDEAANTSTRTSQSIK